MRAESCREDEAPSKHGGFAEVECGEPSAASRVCDERPTSRGALDSAPGSQEGVS